MNANELADYLDNNVEAMLMSEQPHIDQAAIMLRQQADRIELLEHDGKMLMQHIADINEGKSKLRHETIKFARAILRKAQEK